MASLTFDAEIVDMGPAVAIFLTDEMLDTLGGKSVPVTVTINGNTIQARTGTMGGQRLLGLSKANKTALGVDAGDAVTVTIANDTAPRAVEVPSDLAKAFTAAPAARATWGGLTASQQKEYAAFITSAVREETRQRRVEQSIERLTAGAKSPKG